MANTIRYNYHVFGLARGNRKHIEEYIAEGPSNELSEPIIIHRLRYLAIEICNSHIDYLNRQVDETLISDRLRYIGISFEPTCDNVIYDSRMYHTQKLSEREQKNLIGHIRKRMECF